MQEKVGTSFSSLNPFIFRIKMAHKIRKINLNLEGVYRESNEIGRRPVEMISSSTNPTSERVTDPFVDESEIVGRRDDVEKVVSMLTSSQSEKDLAVVGILGMPGQGKTAIAQLVNKNETVVNFFQKRIWLCVSNDFEAERLLNNMVQCLTGTISELTIREAIVRKLNSEMKGKRFLHVLDDVWNEDADLWGCMRNCLQEMGGSQGSMVLVTTRSKRATSIMQASCIHHLETLSDDDSKFLLEKIAFRQEEARKTPHLVNMCKKIAEKCGGVPNLFYS